MPSVAKTVVREGHNETVPLKGSYVTVHVAAHWLSNLKKDEEMEPLKTTFWSTHDHNLGTPFSFYLGLGRALPGMDAAVHTMKVGERAKVHVTPEHAWSDGHPEWGVPADADLVLDLELLAFEHDIEGDGSVYDLARRRRLLGAEESENAARKEEL